MQCSQHLVVILILYIDLVTRFMDKNSIIAIKSGYNYNGTWVIYCNGDACPWPRRLEKSSFVQFVCHVSLFLCCLFIFYSVVNQARVQTPWQSLGQMCVTQHKMVFRRNILWSFFSKLAHSITMIFTCVVNNDGICSLQNFSEFWFLEFLSNGW